MRSVAHHWFSRRIASPCGWNWRRPVGAGLDCRNTGPLAAGFGSRTTARLSPAEAGRTNAAHRSGQPLAFLRSSRIRHRVPDEAAPLAGSPHLREHVHDGGAARVRAIRTFPSPELRAASRGSSPSPSGKNVPGPTVKARSLRADRTDSSALQGWRPLRRSDLHRRPLEQHPRPLRHERLSVPGWKR